MTPREALAKAVEIAGEAQREWDAAPSGMKAGKLLIALAGGLPGYRADIDAIHAVLAAPDMAAACANDAACILYPGEDQEALREAYRGGAALTASEVNP